MQLKLYTNRCLTCDEGDRVTKVRQFAKKNNLEFAMRRIDLMPDLWEEASVFGVRLPFVELDGMTADFLSLSNNPTVEDTILQDLL